MHIELTSHDIAADLVPRHLVWARVEQFGTLPLSEYERMGGHEALKMARNHVDPLTRMPRQAAVRILGELELDRTAPRWGEHRAWLAGDEDAQPSPELVKVQPANTDLTLVAWDAYHALAVNHHGCRLLTELGL